jgi:hypothetical protein
MRRRKSTENHIRRYEVDENEASLFDTLSVALGIRGFETELRAVEVVICKKKPAEVVKISNPLACRVKRQRGRALRDIGKELICQSSLPALYNAQTESMRVDPLHTWKSNFRTKFANEYMPTFFPSGLPSFPTPLRLVPLSVRHIVKALCIDSAVPSTNDFLLSS